MGAKAHLADWSPLRDKHVIVVADRDDAGYKRAPQVAELVDGIAALDADPSRTSKRCKVFVEHLAADHMFDELVPIPEPEPVDCPR